MFLKHVTGVWCGLFPIQDRDGWDGRLGLPFIFYYIQALFPGLLCLPQAILCTNPPLIPVYTLQRHPTTLSMPALPTLLRWRGVFSSGSGWDLPGSWEGMMLPASIPTQQWSFWTFSSALLLVLRFLPTYNIWTPCGSGSHGSPNLPLPTTTPPPHPHPPHHFP